MQANPGSRQKLVKISLQGEFLKNPEFQEFLGNLRQLADQMWEV